MRRQVRVVITLLAFLTSALAAQGSSGVRGVVLNQQTSSSGRRRPGPAARGRPPEPDQRQRPVCPGRCPCRRIYRGGHVDRVHPTDDTSPRDCRSDRRVQTLRLNPAAVNLRDLVVTASKTETERRDVPAAVSVVSGEDLEHRGVTNFSEAVHTAPGVSVGAFGENFNSVQLRGLPRFGNENEAVLILLDGVPQTDARNSAQLLTLPIENIDRIEVVKGPNSAIYGRTAIGGVVNIITTDPEYRARIPRPLRGWPMELHPR